MDWSYEIIPKIDEFKYSLKVSWRKKKKNIELIPKDWTILLLEYFKLDFFWQEHVYPN